MNDLLTWWWQGSLIALVAAAAVRLMPVQAAAKRYVILCTALIAVVALPGLPLVIRPIAGVAADPAPLGGGAGLGRLGTLSQSVALPAPPAWLGLFVVLGWILTTIVVMARALGNVARLRTIRARSWPIDPARIARLRTWRAACGASRRRVELRVSKEVRGACALGLDRPTILISADLANALDDESLEAVLLHELAHLDRFDDWSCLLQQLLTAVAAIHPAVHWLSRQINVEREVACDASVIARTGTAWRYSRSLTYAAAVVLHGRGTRGLSVPGSSTTPSLLQLRVRRAIAPRAGRWQLREQSTFVAAVAALLLAVTIAGGTPSPVLFESASAHDPHAPGALSAAVPLQRHRLPSRQRDALEAFMPPTALPRDSATLAATPAAPPQPSDLRRIEPAMHDAVNSSPARPSGNHALHTLEALPIASLGSDVGVAVAVEARLESVPGDVPSVLPSASLPSVALQPLATATSDSGDSRGLTEPFVSFGSAVGAVSVNAGVVASRAGISIGRFFKNGGQAIARGLQP